MYELGYQAAGWRTLGDALLTNTAANLARLYADTGRAEVRSFAPVVQLPAAS